jgi:hypothetical protein
MADWTVVKPSALGCSFLSQASVKDSSGAASSDHPFRRYDARRNRSKSSLLQN